MNEAETRTEYIDPKLKNSGWVETEGTSVHDFSPILKFAMSKYLAKLFNI